MNAESMTRPKIADPNLAATLHLPEGASLFTRLRVAVRALKILEKDPPNVIAAPVLNAALDGGIYERLSRELRNTPEGIELLTARPELQGSALDLNALAALPDGTLGHELARYFRDNQIQPFDSPFEIRNDVDYLAKRYRETHDLAHVLTGYRTDVVGEMELQAFMIGNMGIHTGKLIVTFAIALRPHGLTLPFGEYIAKLKQAYRRGKSTPPLISVRYERYWDKPVEQVRDALGIPPLSAFA